MKKITKPISQSATKIDLKTLFSGFAQEMRATFKTLGSISHGPTKGLCQESEWILWLRRYLPQRYSVGTGFIVDSKGEQSAQQDIIIFDRQYSPLFMVHPDVQYIPAEAVYAVIEVKTNLSKPELLDAAEKISSVKSLYRAPAQDVVHAGGVFPPQQRGRILGFVASYSTVWKGHGIWGNLEKILTVTSDQIDGGCVLDKGAFSAFYSPKRAIIQHTTSANDALIGFLGLMTEEIKKLGTTPPWDLAEYSSVLLKLRAPVFKQAVKPTKRMPIG